MVALILNIKPHTCILETNPESKLGKSNSLTFCKNKSGSQLTYFFYTALQLQTTPL